MFFLHGFSCRKHTYEWLAQMKVTKIFFCVNFQKFQSLNFIGRVMTHFVFIFAFGERSGLKLVFCIRTCSSFSPHGENSTLPSLNHSCNFIGISCWWQVDYFWTCRPVPLVSLPASTPTRTVSMACSFLSHTLSVSPLTCSFVQSCLGFPFSWEF